MMKNNHVEEAEAMYTIERRQVKRVKFQMPVELETANHLDKSRPFRLKGETADLSERGIGLAVHMGEAELMKFLVGHTKYALIRLPVGQQSETQEIWGKISWFDYARQGEHYTFSMGLLFEELEEPILGKVKELIGSTQ
jgi:c-di-GMP-binding flagellar brake protein YcgR